MLNLYDVNHKKIAGLVNYKDLNIEREINALPILSFLYPVNDEKFPLILEECYIRTKENEYVVKEVNYSDDNYNQYVCKVSVEELQGNLIDHFDVENNTCENCIKLALSSTSWTLGVCTVLKKRTVRKNNSSVYDVLQEIQSAYKCEITYDAVNKKINVYEKMGNDRGAYFTEQLNLKKLDIQRNSYDYITRLFPTGKDGLGIEGVNGGIKYIENYQYSNKKISAYWSDDRYTDAGELLEDAIERLNFLSKPLISYKADVYDLAKCSENYKSILEYGLGDTVTLLSKSNKVREKQRIVKLTEYPEEPEKNTVEIANRITSLEDLNVRFIETSDTVDDVTTSDGEIDGSKIDKIEWGKIQNAKIGIADVNELNATISNIGKLSASEGDVTILNSVNGNIKNLLSDKVTTSDLKAATGRISTLESNSAKVNNLLAGNIGAENIKAGAITAGSSIIAEGAIGHAQIGDVDIASLNSGNIDSSKIGIISKDGRMIIKDNSILFYDYISNDLLKPFLRVQSGKIFDINKGVLEPRKDSNDNYIYGFEVRNKNGETIMIDGSGVHREGITDGAVDNTKIAPNANIDGAKLDIASVINEINKDGTGSINSSKILLDDKSLDIKISEVQTSIENIKIGGRNLLQNSGFLKGTSHWILGQYYNVDSTVKFNDQNTIKYEASGITSQTSYMMCNNENYCNEGDIFTASVYVKTDDITSLDKNDYGLALEINFIDNNGNVINYTGNEFFISQNDTWERHSYTCEAPKNSVKARFSFYTARNGRIWIAAPKLEAGNKVTDYEEAPEDILARISESNVNINSINDVLTNKIKIAETNISNSSEEIALKASKLSVDELKNAVSENSTSIKEMASGISIEVSKINTSVGAAQNDITAIKNNLIFNDKGLSLGKSDNPLQISIDNEAINFLENDKPIAYINGQKMYIESLEVLKSAIIGVHKIEKYNSDVTFVSWVGEGGTINGKN